jgi:hypothetical protein
MKDKRPFLEDGSQFGISRTAFRRMRKAERRELMVSWFHQNFEDPAQRTSYNSAEGGYLWNHGGPYDAEEELFDKFGDIVSEALIKEVTKEVESEGLTDWTYTPQREDYEDDEPPPGSLPFESFTDEPTEQYGSQQDHAARERARTALRELLAALNEPRPAGIGHNNPPEDEEDADTAEKVGSIALVLHTELGKSNPSIPLVKRFGIALREAAVASIRWVGRKADLAFETAIKATIPTIAVAVIAHYDTPIHKALEAVLAWLSIVAHSPF